MACRSKIDEKWNWDKNQNFGMFTYLLSKRPGRDGHAVKAVKDDLIAVADVCF
jgi:endoglucanase